MAARGASRWTVHLEATWTVHLEATGTVIPRQRRRALGIGMANGIFPLINVSNLDKTIEWFKAVGVKTEHQEMGPMTWGSVTSGDGSLMLFPKDAPTMREQPEDTRAWLSGDLGKGVLIQVGVPNAKKAWAKAENAGFVVDEPLTENPWGGSGFRLIDPDGYVIAFADKFPAGPRKAKPRVAKAKPKARAKPKPKAKGKRR